MMMTKLVKLIPTVVLLCLSLTQCAGTFVSRCKTHSPTSDGHLQFKETALVEIAYVGVYKSISCYANNFCGVSWQKDGSSIPDDVFLEDYGQRLEFHESKSSHEGSYTCTATNGHVTIQQTISLHVLNTDCTGVQNPILVSHPDCKNFSTTVGANVTFTCEFYVNASVEVTWFKTNETARARNESHYTYNMLLYVPDPDDDNKLGGVLLSQELQYTGQFSDAVLKKCPCTCSPNVIVQLRMDNFTQGAFGNYTLVVTLPDDYLDISVPFEISVDVEAQPPPFNQADVAKVSVAIIVCLLVAGFLILVTYYRFQMDIKLFYKHKLAPSRPDDKEFDVYLSYDWDCQEDRCFAMSLVNHLNHWGYKVYCEMDSLPGTDREEDIVATLETSRRCIIIFSPDYLASLRNVDIFFAMDNVTHYKKEIIPIMHRDISVIKSSDRGALVEHILAMGCLRFDQISIKTPNIFQKIVKNVRGDPFSEKSLYKELHVKLPPPGRSNSGQHGTGYDSSFFETVSEMVGSDNMAVDNARGSNSNVQ